MEKNHGYIYVIKMLDYYKIGQTTKLKQRIESYNGLPKKPTIILSEFVSDRIWVEKELHKIFDNKRCDGEWFKLLDNDIEIIKSFIEENQEFVFECFENKNIVDVENRPKVEINKGLKYYNCVKESNDMLLKEFADSPATYYACMMLKSHIRQNNLILKDDETKYKLKDFYEELGISKNTAILYMKRIIQKEVIAKIKTRQGQFYVFNPFICCIDKSICVDVFNLFKDSKWNYQKQKICN